MLVQGARCFPQKKALVYRDWSTTYERLNGMVDQTALYLKRLGVKKGERVAIYLPNIPEWPMFYYGTVRLGAIAVCIASAYKRDEVTRLVSDSLSSVLITCEELLPNVPDRKIIPHVKDIVVVERDQGLRTIVEDKRSGIKDPVRVECEGDDVATFLYTGGTTGVPKGAMLTHRNLLYSAQMVCYYERTVPEDVGICFMPLNHVFGLCHIMNSMFFGCATLVLFKAFDMDAILQSVSENKITPLLCRSDDLHTFFEQPGKQKKPEVADICILGGHEHARRDRASVERGISSSHSRILRHDGIGLYHHFQSLLSSQDRDGRGAGWPRGAETRGPRGQAGRRR